MNTNIFTGNWEQLKGKIKSEWAELTDDDLKKIEANSQKLYGILEKKYGYTKQVAQKKIEAFIEKFDDLDKSTFQKEIEQLKSSLSDSAEKINDIVHKNEKKITGPIVKYPLYSIGIAAAIGFTLGALLW